MYNEEALFVGSEVPPIRGVLRWDLGFDVPRRKTCEVGPVALRRFRQRFLRQDDLALGFHRFAVR